MIVEIIIKSEENNCREVLSFTGESIKEFLENNPKELLRIIEEIHTKFPSDKRHRTIGF